MTSHVNYRRDKNKKHVNDRSDIYEPEFQSAIVPTKEDSVLAKNLPKWVEFASFLRFYPDIFYDIIAPTEGKKMILHLDQRVRMRALVRFLFNYFCMPRGSGKTLEEIMVLYFLAIVFPGITLAITASTKESSMKIWKDKHDEILGLYPSLKDEIQSNQFAKDSGRVVFQNGSVIDNLANAQSSKGLRRRRGSLEESALIDKDLFEDAIEPIFNVGRTTVNGLNDPQELNGQINRFSTSGYKNSDEYGKILEMTRSMLEGKNQFVFGSDWMLPVHFGRQKISTINSARKGNIVRFRQNYLCDWIGVSDGGLINISKLIKSRVLTTPELECPKDKKGNFEINEYVIGCDIARSNTENNNKTSIVVLKLIRNTSGMIRQIQVVNIVNPPNGLNFDEQSIIIKRVFYQYGGNIDLTKSRVKAVVIDINGVGQGVLESLLKDITDYDNNEELPAWATINTEDKSSNRNAPQVIYGLKAQGINSDIIRIFIDSIESNKLKLIRQFDDIRDKLPKDVDPVMAEVLCFQTQQLIDEVANLKLKKSDKTNGLSVESVVKRVDKDRYSALAYALYYIFMFMNEEEEEMEDILDVLLSYSQFS